MRLSRYLLVLPFLFAFGVEAQALSESTDLAYVQDDVSTQVRQIIADQLGLKLEDVGTWDTLEGLGADDLDRWEIAMELESTFEIEIPDKEVENWGTVQSIIDSVKS